MLSNTLKYTLFLKKDLLDYISMDNKESKVPFKVVSEYTVFWDLGRIILNSLTLDYIQEMKTNINLKLNFIRIREKLLKWNRLLNRERSTLLYQT